MKIDIFDIIMKKIFLWHLKNMRDSEAAPAPPYHHIIDAIWYREAPLSKFVFFLPFSLSGGLPLKAN